MAARRSGENESGAKRAWMMSEEVFERILCVNDTKEEEEGRLKLSLDSDV